MLIKLLRRVSVRSRIIGSFIIPLLFLTLSIPLIATNYRALTGRIEQIASVDVESQRLLLSSQARILSSRVNLTRYAGNMLPSTSEAQEDVKQAIDFVEKARKLIPITATDQQSAMSDILGGLVSYSTLIDNVQQARQQNKQAEAETLLTNSYGLEFNLEQQITAVVDLNTAYVNQSNKAALAETQRRLTWLASAYFGLLILAAIIAVVIQRSVTQPVLELRQGAENFRKERKATAIPVTGQDDLSILAQTFNQITAELGEIMSGLEKRVEERTQALATVADISTATSTILDPDKLLHSVVELSKERFNLYHSHIYLLDETGENLVLVAGAGEPGRIMVSEGRSIPFNREQSLVARAAREKKGVIVNDVTQSPDFLPNPLLPNTRAELAVPMLVGEKVIGVFDVQSDQIGRFTESDSNVQITLAAQIAAAVQNARLYTRAETTRLEAQTLVDYATEAICVLDLETGLFTDPNESASKLYGLPREELVKVGPAQMSPPRQPDGRDTTEKALEMIGVAMQTGTNIFEWTHRNAQGQDIDCEIRLVRMPGERPRLRVTVTDITERKRNEELTRQRALFQESLNLITQKIQSTTSVESALQVTARELGHALGMKQTLVALENPATADKSQADLNHQSAV
jgi:PAS domain S-box-containing protein